MIMKILAVFVLVFLTGCNGGHHEHLSQYQVEMVQDAYWKYVQKSTMTSEDSVEDIRYSPPGQYLCFLISQSINVIHTFFRLVYAHIVLWTTDFFHKLCHEVDHLHHELEHFLHHLEDDIHYHAKELAAQIRCKLEDLKKCAAHYIEGLDSKGLKKALIQKCQELHEDLNKCFEHLHTHNHHQHDHHHHHYGHLHHQLDHHHYGHHHHGHKPPGHKHPGHHHHGHNHPGQKPPGHNHPGHHHHHHHGHHLPGQKPPGHHHHGHNHPSHHHHHHHGHHHHGHHLPGQKPPGHKHPGHHHHGHKDGTDMKKKVDESMEGFKATLFSLVHSFEIKLAQTTNEINKKIVPHRRRHGAKLVQNSDHLKDDLESIWNDWMSFSQKKTH
ncbi:histidine-rich glycoprotein-like [Girardinichthys multiradiatus]|uniref:histidine-rich glycoprotein-like n=1 Tax=Girardinichthys multiradiatus TaxID=208333 RepID=UPI001FAD35A8|nr:histidine-rich glycoprotein-like [Girardinichthys multiradiatus]